jgi:hypothetical protein
MRGSLPRGEIIESVLQAGGLPFVVCLKGGLFLLRFFLFFSRSALRLILNL